MSTENQREIIEKIRLSIRNNKDFRPPKFETDRLRILLIIIDALIFILLMILYLADAGSEKILWTTLAGYVLTTVLMLWDLPLVVVAVLKPAKYTLKYTYPRLRGSDTVVTSLQSEAAEDLVSAREHVQFEMERLNFRTSLVAGSLGKLGIVPAAFAIYFSYYLKLEDSLPEKTAVAAMTLIVGAYVLSLFFASVAERLKLIVYLLDRAIEQRKKNDTEQNVEPVN